MSLMDMLKVEEPEVKEKKAVPLFVYHIHSYFREALLRYFLCRLDSFL